MIFKKYICYTIPDERSERWFGEMATLDQLKDVALHHFATHGYDGASLANIASEVGIKKQSIYTYFKGKDELFLQIFEDTCTQEISIVKNDMEQMDKKSLKSILYTFLEQTIDRFHQRDSTKFMLRNAFLPPVHLHEEVINEMYRYLDQLQVLFLPIFQEAIEKGEIRKTINADMATTAFIGVMDSLYVEMLYGNAQRLQKRFDASWSIFWEGISDVTSEEKI